MRALIVTEADYANLSLLRGAKALQRALAEAQVVPSDNVPPEILTMNSQAVLCDVASGSRRLVTLVYPADASAARGGIAVTEALGTALLGASPGQMIDDGGQRLRVEKVLHQPERSLRKYLVLRGS
jgi:regulator of nucleoside diphosphate kinase